MLAEGLAAVLLPSGLLVPPNAPATRQVVARPFLPAGYLEGFFLLVG